MPRHPQIEDLAYATSSGLLAEEVVFGLGKLLVGEKLEDDQERAALQTAGSVLQAIIDSDVSVPARAGTAQLAASEEALDALQAALGQSTDENVQAYLARLNDTLTAALAGESVTARKAELESLQNLFATFGHITLARANRLTRAPLDRLTWPISHLISAS
jgi:hypothetical protein